MSADSPTPARSVFSKRFWLALGLSMVLAGFGTATAGFIGAREAKQLAEGEMKIVVQAVKPGSPTTKKSSAAASAKKSSVAKKSGTATTRGSTLAARKKKSMRPLGAPETVAPVVSTLPAKVSAKWSRMVWWGSAALTVGIASVAYSIHEMKPKIPKTGAEEMLKEEIPF